MNKIINRFQLAIICIVVFLLNPQTGRAQDSKLNKYGLMVISKPVQLQQTCRKDPDKTLTDLKKRIPGLVTELKYCTSGNFMHRQLYPKLNTTWLRKPAADSLFVIQSILNEKGLGLKVFDAYRPYSVTEAMWEPIKDERYVADPKKGSGHNRGVAVDLTIIDLKTGKELEMGTGYDDFSDSAHHDYSQLPEHVLQNRQLLKSLMEKHGFLALDSEWWHYSLPHANAFELMDLSFRDLEKIK